MNKISNKYRQPYVSDAISVETVFCTLGTGENVVISGVVVEENTFRLHK